MITINYNQRDVDTTTKEKSGILGKALSLLNKVKERVESVFSNVSWEDLELIERLQQEHTNYHF